jgi:hypothetical protein
VIERMHWSRVLSPGVRIWPAIATPEMLCDKLTANMSHKQWREWVSADIELGRIVLRATIPGD